MKKIEAIFPSLKFEAVRSALFEQNLHEFILGRVAVDEPDGILDEPMWSNTFVAFSPRLNLELTVPDGLASPLAHTIFRAARARKMARTSVVILPLEELIEIDSGERMT